MQFARWDGTRLGVHGALLVLLALGAALGQTVHVLILMGSLAAHELAHLAAARLAGVDVQEIQLTPFGGVARLDPALEADPQAEVAVALAGPFQSSFLAMLGLALAPGAWWDRDLLRFFVSANAGLALFNLLPALPLDGGRALRGLLAQRLGYGRVTRWMAWSGRVTGAGMALFGLGALAAGHAYWTPLVGGPYLFWLAGREPATALYRSFGQLLRKRSAVRERRVMPATSLVALAGARLEEVLPHLAARRYHLVLVVDDDLRPLGTLDEERLVRAFSAHGPAVTLGEVLEQV